MTLRISIIVASVKNNHSGYKGVIKVKRNGIWRGKWVARIAIKGNVFSSSECDTAVEAHAEYCRMAKQFHGEFARGA